MDFFLLKKRHYTFVRDWNCLKIRNIHQRILTSQVSELQKNRVSHFRILGQQNARFENRHNAFVRECNFLKIGGIYSSIDTNVSTNFYKNRLISF